MLRTLLITLCLCNGLFLYGQNTSGFHVQLTHENDFLAPANGDYNYTGGLKIELQTPGFLNQYQPFFRFRKGGNSVLNIQKFAFGGTAYTPLNLKSGAIQYGDRPYASFVFGSIGRQSFSADNKKMVSSELFLGKVGTSGPGRIQYHLHETNFMGSTRDNPEGWDNQIAFPGAFVVNYNFRYRELLLHSHQWKAKRLLKRVRSSALKPADLQLLNRFDYSKSDSLETITSNLHTFKKFELVQLQWHGGMDLGLYMNNVQTGVTLYLLNFNSSPFLNNRPELPAIYSAGNTKQNRYLRFNFFLEPTIRFSAFNATLEGMLFNDRSAYTIAADRVKRILFELNSGMNLLVGDILYLRYNLAIRSQEFVGGKQWHKWGAVSIGFSTPAWHRRNVQ